MQAMIAEAPGCWRFSIAATVLQLRQPGVRAASWHITAMNPHTRIDRPRGRDLPRDAYAHAVHGRRVGSSVATQALRIEPIRRTATSARSHDNGA
jgi:hypothetical protein